MLRDSTDENRILFLQESEGEKEASLSSRVNFSLVVTFGLFSLQLVFRSYYLFVYLWRWSLCYWEMWLHRLLIIGWLWCGSEVGSIGLQGFHIGCQNSKQCLVGCWSQQLVITEGTYWSF